MHVPPSSEGSEPINGRLGQISAVERAVEQAKVALGRAEEAMADVQAGLALEPMYVHIEPPPLPEMPRAADDGPPSLARRTLDRIEAIRSSLDFVHVPTTLQVLALIGIGWTLAMGAVWVVGRSQMAQWAGHVIAAVPGMGSASKSSLSRTPAGADFAEEPRERDVVVIYEPTSPYPARFGGVSAKERHCLAEAIYYEARGEPAAGQIAVAQVVLNRANGGSWPRNICEVTNQGKERAEKCQFSYACQRAILSAPGGDAWTSAMALADDVLDGGAFLEEMIDATHFHRVDLKPVWRVTLGEIGRVGRHVFYTSPTENRRPFSRQFTTSRGQ